MSTLGTEHPDPVSDRRALSTIAYGFMASKALFAALSVDLFTHLEAGLRTCAELSAGTGVAGNRMQTLLHALAGLGLLEVDGSGYRNAPACRRHLVRGAPGDFGDYFRLQVGGQIYPALLHLDEGLAGTGAAFDTLGGLLSDPAQARVFVEAQHAGSRAAAQVLAGYLELDAARALLDVGGGSGAFSIALCERNPQLRATLIDFPAVIDIAREYRRAAAPGHRIELLPGDAVHIGWPPEQDVVVLSYLLSALGADEMDTVLAKARDSLRPGGLLVVHDFMLDDDGPGPALAALWFLQYVAYRGDAVSFSARDLGARLAAHGFMAPSCRPLIPDITKVLVSRRTP